MVRRITGLIFTKQQMYDMASFLTQTTVDDMGIAFHTCCNEIEKVGRRMVGIDYPERSKRFRLMLVLHEHKPESRINIVKSNETKLVATARAWLKARGIVDADNLELVDAEDPYYY